MNLLILGASARAAASSALRAGLQPIGIDLFGDRDLCSACPCDRVPAGTYPEGLEPLAAARPPGPWLYTGALENHPGLVARIASRRPLWGNPAETLRAVRDPFALSSSLRRAGLPCPEVRPDPGGLPRDGSWLAKPLDSGGGLGIRPLDSDTVTDGRPSYYQERIAGLPLSATYLGAGGTATLAGVTRQFLGRPGAAFAYVGSLGPWPLSRDERRRIEALGTTLASAFGLRGLFGVDLILRHGEPWPLEVNPRYSASVEVLELALGVPLLAEHRRQFDPEAPPTVAVPIPEGRQFVGKRILFAKDRCRFPDHEHPGAAPADPFAVPDLGDLPWPGTCFDPGEPIVTVFASGSDPAECDARLEAAGDHWESRLDILEEGQ